MFLRWTTRKLTSWSMVEKWRIHQYSNQFQYSWPSRKIEKWTVIRGTNFRTIRSEKDTKNFCWWFLWKEKSHRIPNDSKSKLRDRPKLFEMIFEFCSQQIMILQLLTSRLIPKFSKNSNKNLLFRVRKVFEFRKMPFWPWKRQKPELLSS